MKRKQSWVEAIKKIEDRCGLVVRDERSIDFKEVLEVGWYVVEVRNADPECIAFDVKGHPTRGLRAEVIEGPYADRAYAAHRRLVLGGPHDLGLGWLGWG